MVRSLTFRSVMIAAIWFNRGGCDIDAMQRSHQASPQRSAMTKLSLPIVSTFTVLHAVTSLAYAQATDKTSDEP
jgi:hypothetical protein